MRSNEQIAQHLSNRTSLSTIENGSEDSDVTKGLAAGPILTLTSPPGADRATAASRHGPCSGAGYLRRAGTGN